MRPLLDGIATKDLPIREPSILLQTPNLPNDHPNDDPNEDRNRKAELVVPRNLFYALCIGQAYSTDLAVYASTRSTRPLSIFSIAYSRSRFVLTTMIS